MKNTSDESSKRDFGVLQVLAAGGVGRERLRRGNYSKKSARSSSSLAERRSHPKNGRQGLRRFTGTPLGPLPFRLRAGRPGKSGCSAGIERSPSHRATASTPQKSPARFR